jgi:hypothetical protein
MSPLTLTRIIDSACGPFADRLAQARAPRRILVHPEAFAAIAGIRAREMADGLPLMLLGMELASAASVPVDGFEFED